MDESHDQELPLSKTKKKQQAKAVEGIAAQLVGLPDQQFSQLRLSEELRQESELARRTCGRGSQKRQLKHLAGLLRHREQELEQLLLQLQQLDQVSRTEKRDFHRLESLRDQLCDPKGFEAAYRELQVQFSQLDLGAIARLARSVQQHQDRRAYREIFRRLRAAAAEESS